MRNRTKDAITVTSTKELIRIHAQVFDPEQDILRDVWGALSADVADELMRRHREGNRPAAELGRISRWISGRDR